MTPAPVVRISGQSTKSPQLNFSAQPPPVPQLLLYVRCRNLLQMDWFSLLHPVVVLFTRQPGSGAYRYVDQTEMLRDQLQPDFQKPFLVMHKPGTQQEFLLRVYNASSRVTGERAVLCQARVNLDALVSEHAEGEHMCLQLQHPARPLISQQLRKEQSSIHVRYVPFVAAMAHRERLELALSAHNLPLQLSTQQLDGTLVPVAALYSPDPATRAWKHVGQTGKPNSDPVNPIWSSRL